MPRTFTCLHCGKLTTRNPRLKKKQKYCSSRKCQNARKRAFDKKVDPTLKCRMLRKQRNKRWRDNKPAHEYQHSYRNLHPDYVSIKRKQQKKRNILHNKGSSSIIVKTDALFLQSIDYFGPVVIPMKGMQIELDSFKFEKYGFIISEYENGKAAIKNEYFRALSESSYSFSKDYYFFMGDNRHNSIDSRYIGVIPADKISGKVNRVLFSVDNGKFDWGRTLRRVR